MIERESELASLERSLAEARASRGGTTLIEAPAGGGKSLLLTAAGQMATQAEMLLLAASGSELERRFEFGLAIQLFEPLVAADPSLLAGPAQAAAALFDGTTVGADAGGDRYPLIHGLLWLASNLASAAVGAPRDEGLVLLADDLQWADRWSLRFLTYLAERIAQLPIAVVVAARAGETTSDARAFTGLRRAARARTLRPGPLSSEGVAAVVQRRFPDAPAEFSAAAAALTGGNPFLLTELLDKLRDDGRAPPTMTAGELAGMVPDSVLESVVARLDAMPAPVAAVAKAVAVLGAGASPRELAAVAGIEVERALAAADALAAVHILNPGLPLSFAEALTGSAVAASLSAFSRARAHRRAATVLSEDGASAERIAVHLLGTPAQDDPAAVEILREAASAALNRGEHGRAAQLLGRALAERPSGEVLVELLADLGLAEARLGLPSAAERLEEARRISEHPERRAELALAQSDVLYKLGRYRHAASVLEAELAGPGVNVEPLVQELLAAYVSAASMVPELRDPLNQRRKAVLRASSGDPTPRQRAAVAHAALHDGLTGAPRDTVRRLADLGWGDGRLLDAESPDGLSWSLLSGALLFTDELERQVEICDAVLGLAQTAPSPPAQATARFCRAWARYAQGSVLEAQADAEAALAAPTTNAGRYIQTARWVLACCHIERDELDQADTALDVLEREPLQRWIRDPLLLDARARLRLAQHRPAEALRDASEAGRALRSQPEYDSPGMIPWRSTAALAQLALGRRDAARELADAELGDARRIGVTRIVIRDLRVLGLAAGGDPGIELLTEAARAGDSYPPRLEHALALVDLGAALRRSSRRADAREPLRRGLELSSKGGASVLAARARTELVATGARPRRPARSGTESLTASQRRVAELAARGLTNRQIADSLFVTPKTVEFHLRHIYQKLHLSSREQFAEAIAPR